MAGRSAALWAPAAGARGLTSVVLASLFGVTACAPKPVPATTVPVSSQKTYAAQGPKLGPIYFDPQRADFTVWINHLKNEVYRNWIVPQTALLTANDPVDMEFTVEKTGSMSGLRLLKSSGSPLLDEAAANALTRSQFAALPEEYRAASVTMQITFYYKGRPR